MSRLSEKQLLIVTISVTVLLTGGLGFLIWRDLSVIDEEERTIADLRLQIDAAEAEIKQQPPREHRVIANREIAEKEVSFLPEETEIESFWEVLWRFAEESGVQISEITPNTSRSGGRKGSTIASVRQLLSVRGTVDEFLRFINHVENYDRIINVADYGISRGNTADEDGKVRHNIRLALTTFTYSKRIANTIVSIQQYDKKKEHPEVKKWLSRIKLQEKQTYSLRTSLSRRDPFVNVRRRVADQVDPGGEGDEVTRETQEEIIDQLVDQIRTLKEGLDIEDHLRKIKDLFRLAQQQTDNRDAFQRLERRIQEVQRDKLVVIRELTERFRTEVLQPFHAIKQRLGKMDEEEPKKTESEVREWLLKVKRAFDDRAWKKVHDLVRGFLDASQDGDWVEDEAKTLVVEMAGFLKRAEVIQRFEKRRIDITAIVYAENGVSVAVINGKQIQTGDALDGDGSVIVAEIGENFVIFATEAVEIKRLQNQ